MLGSVFEARGVFEILATAGNAVALWASGPELSVADLTRWTTLHTASGTPSAGGSPIRFAPPGARGVANAQGQAERQVDRHPRSEGCPNRLLRHRRGHPGFRAPCLGRGYPHVVPDVPERGRAEAVQARHEPADGPGRRSRGSGAGSGSRTKSTPPILPRRSERARARTPSRPWRCASSRTTRSRTSARGARTPASSGRWSSRCGNRSSRPTSRRPRSAIS